MKALLGGALVALALLSGGPAVADHEGSEEWMRMQGERERALNQEELERRQADQWMRDKRREMERDRRQERMEQNQRARDWNREQLDRRPPR